MHGLCDADGYNDDSEDRYMSDDCGDLRCLREISDMLRRLSWRVEERRRSIEGVERCKECKGRMSKKKKIFSKLEGSCEACEALSKVVKDYWRMRSFIEGWTKIKWGQSYVSFVEQWKMRNLHSETVLSHHRISSKGVDSWSGPIAEGLLFNWVVEDSCEFALFSFSMSVMMNL
jgi:hypothetical protein